MDRLKVMDSHQFEDFIAELLEKVGFDVKKTALLDDEEVSLIATFENPVVPVKYIIQCKKWIGNVGHPEVKDLHETIVSQNANGGAIIASSDFTERAYQAVKGTPITLINGKKLYEILKELDYDVSDMAIKAITISNKRPVCYDERYYYLRQCIEDVPNEKTNYINLVEHLRDFLREQDEDACTETVFDEITYWNGTMINRAMRGGTEPQEITNAMMIKVESLMLGGLLAEATEMLMRYDRFGIKSLRKGGAWVSDERPNTWPPIYSWNLYAAFKHIGYERGCNFILAKCPEHKLQYLDDYMEKGFGTKFIIPEIMTSKGYLDTSSFYSKDFYDPQFFFDRFYTKSNEEYAKELDKVFRLYGMS